MIMAEIFETPASSLAQQNGAGNHCGYDSQKVISGSNRPTDRACGYPRHVGACESRDGQQSKCGACEAHQSMRTFSRGLTCSFSLKPITPSAAANNSRTIASRSVNSIAINARSPFMAPSGSQSVTPKGLNEFQNNKDDCTCPDR